MKSNNEMTDSYISGIDGLRAIAVLSVIIYHFNNRFLPGGFIGVDVFFVISGYVISKSLAAREWRTFGDLIIDFYKRRILRIFPALIFFLIIVSILQALFIPNAWLSSSNRVTAITAFFGVSNIYLVSAADGYFSQRIPFNPFVHTWSLAVEEQFYLFFPFVFYFWLKTNSRNSSYRIITFWSLPVIALASLALSAYQSSYARDYAFYLLPSRCWELAAGAILLQLQIRNGLKLKIENRSALMLFFGAIILAFGFAFADESHFPFPWALLPVIGTLLMIVGTTNATSSRRSIQGLIESKAITYIGRISYSLYLWHWAVFSFFRWTVGMESLLAQCIAILLTFSLSAFSYHYIENNFRRNKFIGNQPSWKIVTGGLVLIGISALSVAFIFIISNKFQFSLSNVNKDKFVWSNNYDTTSFAKIDDHAVGAGRIIFIIGDSHAGAYGSMVKAAAVRLGAEVKMFGRSGCPIAALITASRDDDQCRNFSKEAVEWVKRQAKPGDIVFFASLRVPRFGDQWTLFNQDSVLSRSKLPAEIKVRQVALNQAIELTENLRAMGLNILMNAPMPIFKAPPFRCSDWFNKFNPICAPGFSVDRLVLQNHREPTMASLRVLHDFHHVYVWDPFPVLCNGPECSAFDGDKPIFEDGDHLSGYGSRLLIPSFTNQLIEVWETENGLKKLAQLSAVN